MPSVRIPDDFLPYLPDLAGEVIDKLRCADCGGYGPYAAVIGIVGRFCSCPFDAEHP